MGVIAAMYHSPWCSNRKWGKRADFWAISVASATLTKAGNLHAHSRYSAWLTLFHKRKRRHITSSSLIEAAQKPLPSRALEAGQNVHAACCKRFGSQHATSRDIVRVNVRWFVYNSTVARWVDVLQLGCLLCCSASGTQCCSPNEGAKNHMGDMNRSEFPMKAHVCSLS